MESRNRRLKYVNCLRVWFQIFGYVNVSVHVYIYNNSCVSSFIWKIYAFSCCWTILLSLRSRLFACVVLWESRAMNKLTQWHQYNLNILHQPSNMHTCMQRGIDRQKSSKFQDLSVLNSSDLFHLFFFFFRFRITIQSSE